MELVPIKTCPKIKDPCRHSADRYLGDQEIGIMEDRHDFERLRGFGNRLSDGLTDGLTDRLTFAIPELLLRLNN